MSAIELAMDGVSGGGESKANTAGRAWFLAQAVSVGSPVLGPPSPRPDRHLGCPAHARL
ncbi:hypothetical protein GCM10011504_29890 [Siccirubricoccus deserti]|nr:hypothetical protein GCM10011504_29890 [Siccirubricoccus deserti]